MSEWLTGRGGREGGVQGKGKEKEPGKAQSPEAASVSRLGVKLQQVSRKESRHHMDIEPETSHGPPVTSHQGAWASRQRLILSRILLGLGLRV